jgi:hypothetical protein
VCKNLVYKVYFWVSYFRPWFLWLETMKLVIPFLRIYLIASLLSVHCVSPHRRSHKPSILKTKYHLLWLPPWPQPIVEYGSSIQGRSMLPRLKTSSISPKESISGTYFIFITSLPEDEQTSKHGRGGRYNAILEFKGEQIKKWWERKNEKNKERTKIWVWEKEKKKYEYVWYKNRIKWTPRYSEVH